MHLHSASQSLFMHIVDGHAHGRRTIPHIRRATVRHKNLIQARICPTFALDIPLHIPTPSHQSDTTELPVTLRHIGTIYDPNIDAALPPSIAAPRAFARIAESLLYRGLQLRPSEPHEVTNHAPKEALSTAEIPPFISDRRTTESGRYRPARNYSGSPLRTRPTITDNFDDISHASRHISGRRVENLILLCLS